MYDSPHTRNQYYNYTDFEKYQMKQQQKLDQIQAQKKDLSQVARETQPQIQNATQKQIINQMAKEIQPQIQKPFEIKVEKRQEQVQQQVIRPEQKKYTQQEEEVKQEKINPKKQEYPVQIQKQEIIEQNEGQPGDKALGFNHTFKSYGNKHPMSWKYMCPNCQKQVYERGCYYDTYEGKYYYGAPDMRGWAQVRWICYCECHGY